MVGTWKGTSCTAPPQLQKKKIRMHTYLTQVDSFSFSLYELPWFDNLEGIKGNNWRTESSGVHLVIVA